MKVSQRIRKLLAEGPATAREVALSLGIPMRDATVGLRILKKQRHVRVQGTVPNLERGRGQRRQLKLYELTLRGQTHLRMSRKRGAA